MPMDWRRRSSSLTAAYLLLAFASGQEEAPDSLRIDIPKDSIPADNRRRDGVEYTDFDSREEWMQRDGYVNLVRGIMGKSSKP